MLTKTGSLLLEKVALWDFAPRHAKAIYDAARKYSPYIGKATKAQGRLGLKVTDLAARWLASAGKKMVDNPGLYVPLAGAAAVGAYTFERNQPAYEAHIESADSGVTSISPFLGKIKFKDPSYAKYYS